MSISGSVRLQSEIDLQVGLPSERRVGGIDRGQKVGCGRFCFVVKDADDTFRKPVAVNNASLVVKYGLMSLDLTNETKHGLAVRKAWKFCALCSVNQQRQGVVHLLQDCEDFGAEHFEQCHFTPAKAFLHSLFIHLLKRNFKGRESFAYDCHVRSLLKSSVAIRLPYGPRNTEWNADYRTEEAQSIAEARRIPCKQAYYATTGSSGQEPNTDKCGLFFQMRRFGHSTILGRTETEVQQS